MVISTVTRPGSELFFSNAEAMHLSENGKISITRSFRLALEKRGSESRSKVWDTMVNPNVRIYVFSAILRGLLLVLLCGRWLVAHLVVRSWLVGLIPVCFCPKDWRLGIWPSSSWNVPPVETEVIDILVVPPVHPCRFPFLFPFFSFLFFISLFLYLFFPLLLVVLRVPFFLFRSFFVLSSCHFPFDSCIAFFAFAFASLLSLVEDSVNMLFRLGATPPPRSFRAWSMRIPLACCLLCSFFLALLMLTHLHYFSSLPSLFRFRFGHRLFHPVFFLWVLCCLLGFGFCFDSFSIWYIFLDTCADLTFLCLSEVCDLFHLLCVLSCVFYPFSSCGATFRSRVIWACTVTTDYIVAIS